MAVGQPKTISVRLFSTAPIPDWYVSVRQLLGTTGAPTTLRISLDKSTGNNGDILKLTITRTANGPAFGGTVIDLVSSTAPVTANIGASAVQPMVRFRAELRRRGASRHLGDVIQKTLRLEVFFALGVELEVGSHPGLPCGFGAPDTVLATMVIHAKRHRNVVGGPH